MLTAYFREVVSRHHRREATGAEVAAAMRAEPSDDLGPPGGLLLLACHDGAVLGCAGLRLLAARIGEVTRVFVAPQARRHRIGQQLLDAVEGAARRLGVTRLRLDTSDYLTEARDVSAEASCARFHKPFSAETRLCSPTARERPVMPLLVHSAAGDGLDGSV